MMNPLHSFLRSFFSQFSLQIFFLGIVPFGVCAKENRASRKFYSVNERILQYEADVKKRLLKAFQTANVSYPPKAVVLSYSKQEQMLSLYAEGDDQPLTFIKSYPVLAASGEKGPKLREGDLQVPEGIYRIEALNPNSLYHLSLRVNYPNAFDLAHAKQEGRTRLGGDIMIHGKDVSIGCIAIGDLGIEELFILAAKSNYSSWKVVLSPCPLQDSACWKQLPKNPSWLPELYSRIKQELALLPLAKSPHGKK